MRSLVHPHVQRVRSTPTKAVTPNPTVTSQNNGSWCSPAAEWLISGLTVVSASQDQLPYECSSRLDDCNLACLFQQCGSKIVTIFADTFLFSLVQFTAREKVSPPIFRTSYLILLNGAVVPDFMLPHNRCRYKTQYVIITNSVHFNVLCVAFPSVVFYLRNSSCW